MLPKCQLQRRFWQLQKRWEHCVYSEECWFEGQSGDQQQRSAYVSLWTQAMYYRVEFRNVRLRSLHTDSFPLHSALKHVHSLFESQFSTQCGLMLPISTCSILWFLVAAYFFFLVFSSRLLPYVTCFRRQFLRKMWPIQLPFLHFTVCRIFLCSLAVCNTSSFPTRSVQLIFSSLLRRHISRFSRLYKYICVQGDSKRWTKFRTFIFPELCMACEWST